MDKGINAWIANQTPGSDAIITLPGGWQWNVHSNDTGHLKLPDGTLCVGYDLNTNTMQFGDAGKTGVTKLNLWTAQTMGEKFARENFMDPDTAKQYDEFARERDKTRRAYEKDIRGKMTGMIRLEMKQGDWTAHVNVAEVKNLTGIESAAELSRQEGIRLFNQMSIQQQVMPLRDPMGYMTLENNVYDYIKDQYDFQYNDTINSIDAGFINGTGYGCEKILDNLDAVVRKNIREYCIPSGVHYQDLRFVSLTPEIEQAVDEFVKQRVTKTVNYEKRRDHTMESLQRDHEKFMDAGDTLRDIIGNAALAPFSAPEMDTVEELNM